MSDTKLRPEDLTSEERAIVDNAALFYRRVTGDVGETAELAYVEALKEAEPIILARRALFAPAPEKACQSYCPYCDKPGVGHYDKRGFYTCHQSEQQPAPPELSKVCPNCQKPEEEPHFAGNLTGDGGWYFCPGRVPKAVEDHQRPQSAQPLAVGMTEALRMILDVAESRAEDQRHDGLLECSRNLERAIAAVRQQAAQGRKVELGKARKMLEYMRRCAWHEETYQQIEEALAELDAAEGKRRE